MSFRGWITGLEVSRVSATQIKISGGGCDIPSIPATYDGSSGLTTETTLTPTLTASSWHFAYAFANTATQTIGFEVSTVAPVVYYGSARQKTGDTTRRLIGSFKTDASSNIYNFRTYPGGEVRYQEFPGAAPFRVLNVGTASVLTAVNLSDLVPPTSTRALCRVIALGGAAFLSHPGISAEILAVSADKEVITPVELSTSQRCQYRAASGGSCTIDVLGFWEAR